jgi:putrescine transport system permease protein
MKPIDRPGRWLIILPPLLFVLIFFLIPFAFAFKISFADTAARVPPFTDVLTSTPDHHLQFSLSLANYQYLLPMTFMAWRIYIRSRPRSFRH